MNGDSKQKSGARYGSKFGSKRDEVEMVCSRRERRGLKVLV
jgi:hypothetical protein